MFIPPIIELRKLKGSYLEKLELSDSKIIGTTNPYEGSLTYRIRNWMGYERYIWFSYFILSFYITYNIGFSAAINQKDF